MVQCPGICLFSFLLTLSVRQQNADQAISRSICSLLAALRATLLTCFGSLIFCFTDFECCYFFFFCSSKRRDVWRFERLWHRRRCNRPCEEFYLSLAEINTPWLSLCQSHPVGRQWSQCLAGALVGLAEMLRFESTFWFISDILLSFCLWWRNQHPEPETHFLADSCWHCWRTGVGS